MTVPSGSNLFLTINLCGSSEAGSIPALSMGMTQDWKPKPLVIVSDTEIDT